MTIRGEWLDYRTKVIPDNAGLDQLTECQRAFYAGAAAFHHCVFGCVRDEPIVVAHELARVSGLVMELKLFALREREKGSAPSSGGPRL